MNEPDWGKALKELNKCIVLLETKDNIKRLGEVNPKAMMLYQTLVYGWKKIFK